MKLAIVHDYLNQLGGAERVVGTFHSMWPEAPIYTSKLDRNKLWPSLEGAEIHTSWMQSLPFLEAHFKKYLPFYPSAIESFNLNEYDVILSSSSAFAKGARKAPGSTHICYCYTPMRFVWDYDNYIEREQFSPIVRRSLPIIIERMRNWDLRTANFPDQYIAISSVVADRIRKYYNRDCHIIFPPVEVDRFKLSEVTDDYYLIVSRLAPYKRVDLAIRAFNELGIPLVVIGDGPDRMMLESIAGPNIRFLGRLPDYEVNEYFARCRGFIFPGEEDFGIAPLEANASGRPVVAFRGGGTLDTVKDDETGVFFTERTVASLSKAVLRCEAIQWDKSYLVRHANTFSEQKFKKNFNDFLSSVL